MPLAVDVGIIFETSPLVAYLSNLFLVQCPLLATFGMFALLILVAWLGSGPWWLILMTLLESNPLLPMRQVPLERDFNIAANGHFWWRLQIKDGPNMVMLISCFRVTCLIRCCLR